MQLIRDKARDIRLKLAADNAAPIAPVILVGLADNVGHAVIAGTYQNNRVVFFNEKQMRSCLRHLSCCFCRQRVKLDVLRHYVANCFGRIR